MRLEVFMAVKLCITPFWIVISHRLLIFYRNISPAFLGLYTNYCGVNIAETKFMNIAETKICNKIVKGMMYNKWALAFFRSFCSFSCPLLSFSNSSLPKS
jgi:hypothetical protein